MIVFRSQREEEKTRAVWLDSWHVRNDIMVCEGSERDAVVFLRGSYAAPLGPDWGWRIEIEREGPSALVIRMFNVTPSGQEALSVLAEYTPSHG
jgi:hypothetical protein